MPVFVYTLRVRNRRELNGSLKGTTLGDADDDTDNALKWIKKAKKREKELAKKRQEEMDNMDKAVQDEYSESTFLFHFCWNCRSLTFRYRGSCRSQGQPRLRRHGRR